MEFFDRAYEGRPPWETGRPQPAFTRLCDEEEIVGRVLDVGCGTGENALYFASRGHSTWGIDFAPNAVRRAETKARRTRFPITFHVADVLELDGWSERFDTVTDCGLFHTFGDEDRRVYARNVRGVLGPGGRLFVLCFSEEEPTDWGGPRRVSREEIRTAFAEGWRVRWIRRARFETTLPGVEGHAWLSALTTTERVGALNSGPRR